MLFDEELRWVDIFNYKHLGNQYVRDVSNVWLKFAAFIYMQTNYKRVGRFKICGKHGRIVD